MGVWLGPMGFNKVSFITENDYEYTNKSTASIYANDGQGVNWEIAFKANGTLKFKKNPGLIDVFIVDGGKPGLKAPSGDGVSGAGGDGGNCQTVTAHLKSGTVCRIQIGHSGEATTMSVGNIVYNADEGTHTVGGKGANLQLSSSNVNARGEDGMYAYGEESDTVIIASLVGTKFAPSGGGGHARSSTNVISWAHGGVRTGGETGGGNGGDSDASTRDGNDATGFGGGGGGGADNSVYGIKGNGGAGGDGIIIIRNHRSS